MSEALPVWTIYDHPTDHPDSFIARKWLVTAGSVIATREMFAATTLEEIRALLPLGLTCLDRQPLDDPKVIETWV